MPSLTYPLSMTECTPIAVMHLLLTSSSLREICHARLHAIAKMMRQGNARPHIHTTTYIRAIKFPFYPGFATHAPRKMNRGMSSLSLYMCARSVKPSRAKGALRMKEETPVESFVIFATRSFLPSFLHFFLCLVLESNQSIVPPFPFHSHLYTHTHS